MQMPFDWQTFSHFHFLRAEWALLLIPWLFIAWNRRRQNQRDAFGDIIAPHLLTHLRLQGTDKRWFTPSKVSIVFTLLSLLLLMGPSWQQQPSPLNQDEANLVIVIDTSSSMAQNDVQPSRLQRTKQKVSDLLALRPDKKAALIVYSGSAHTVLSPTSDQDILNQYLSAITQKVMPRSGKFPEYALPLLDEILRDAKGPSTVIFFTDGLGANSHSEMASWFDDRPHQLLILGIGTNITDKNLAALDQQSLSELTSAVGGHYFSLSIDDADVQSINRKARNHYSVIEDSALPWLDAGYVLVFPAMAIFLLWFRKGWTLSWGVVAPWLVLPLLLSGTPTTTVAQTRSLQSELAAAHSAQEIQEEDRESAGQLSHKLAESFADLWLTRDQQGHLLFTLEKYDKAASQFTQPMWKATAYYYAEQFMLAAEYFSRSDSNDALFNEANARSHARDYVRAINRYDRLIAREPNFPGATSNRARVQAIVDEINRLSASQRAEQGISSEQQTLGDDAIIAQGADELTWNAKKQKKLSAQQILQDPATQEMWLRGVVKDPVNFLSAKFSMQLHNRAPSLAEKQEGKQE